MKQHQDNIEDKKWLLRMASNNTLGDKVSGMHVFRDKRTGQSFVHLNDLRLALSRKMVESDLVHEDQKRNLIGLGDQAEALAVASGVELRIPQPSVPSLLHHSQSQE